MKRREFLTKAFLASAGISAVAASSSVANDSKRIRCGVLGLGHSHALDVLEVIRQLPDYELAGVCEPDEAIRSGLPKSKALEGVRWLSQEELLGDDSVTMVAVESTVPKLLERGRAVIDAGKHLHLDKPPGTSLPEFRSLHEEAERRGLLIQMGYMFRYNQGFDLVRRAVREGWLGKVYSVHASICTDLTPKKRIIASHHPGGMMLELGCHLIDLIVLLMGPPTKIASFIHHDSDAQDSLSDNAVAVLEYDHAMVTVETAAMEPEAFPARRFKVCGTQGSIILEPLEPPEIRLCLRQPAGEFRAGEQIVKLEDTPRHVRDLTDLAKCIRGEAKFAYSKEHDLVVHETVLRACGVTVQ